MNLLRSISLFLALSIAALATPIQLSFTANSGNVAGGYYVGYTSTTITNGSTTLTNFDALCDDFIHSISVPSGPFSYNLTTLADLSTARWQGVSMLLNYQIAALLLYDFDGLGSGQSALAGDYNFAIWNLFNPSSAPQFGTSAALQADALARVLSNDPSNAAAFNSLLILTPTSQASNSPQEMLAIGTNPFSNPGSPVPEPGTFILMSAGFALVGIGAIRRSRA